MPSSRTRLPKRFTERPPRRNRQALDPAPTDAFTEETHRVHHPLQRGKVVSHECETEQPRIPPELRCGQLAIRSKGGVKQLAYGPMTSQELGESQGGLPLLPQTDWQRAQAADAPSTPEPKCCSMMVRAAMND